MKLYYNKKEYTSVDELSRIFTNDYRVKITPHNVYQICCHYHLTPLYGKFDEYSKRVVPCERKDEDLAFFNDKLVWQIRHMKEDFTDVLDYVVNGDKYDAEWESEPLTDYTPNESNMEYVNNELMNKYQFENMKKIEKRVIRESLRSVLKEYYGGTQQDAALEIMEGLKDLIDKCQNAELYDEAEKLNEIYWEINGKLG